MSKEPKRKPRNANDELRAEYHLDYAKSRPNRFATQMTSGTVAVVLEPDVASVFDSSEAVNQLLRSVISAVPGRQRRTAAKRRKVG